MLSNIKKIEEGTLKVKIFSNKFSQCRKKTERGDPSVSPGIVCYAEKEENSFWFSSLGQMIQFRTIKFRRTFQNYFCQFVWIEKKSPYNSRVSLHEARTKNELQIVNKRCHDLTVVLVPLGNFFLKI